MNCANRRVSALWAVAVAGLALACGEFPTTQGNSSVMQVQIPLTGDTCGVWAASAWVSAPDMVTVGPSQLTIGNDAINGTISVRAGLARTVSIVAYNAQSLAVYSGSTTVDVAEGQTVTAAISLERNQTNCPAMGNIVVVGTINTGPSDGGTNTTVDGGSTDAGVVITGPGLAFGFDDAELTSDGVIHFFDKANDKIYRLDLATRTMKPAITGSLDAVTMAVVPDGSKAYLGYTGGRMDVFDLSTGTGAFFASAPATVSTMIVAGSMLFTIDDSGAWDTQSVFDRATGARTASADWRYSSRSIVWSPLNQKVFFLNSGVSPTDVMMVSLANNTLGAETDSPYHGDYSLPNPVRLLPDESGVIVGSGIIFSASNLSYVKSIGLVFTDVAFLNNNMYLIDAVGSNTQVRTLNAASSITAAAYYPGTPRRIFAYQGGLVLVTQSGTTSTQVRLITP